MITLKKLLSILILTNILSSVGFTASEDELYDDAHKNYSSVNSLNNLNLNNEKEQDEQVEDLSPPLSPLLEMVKACKNNCLESIEDLKAQIYPSQSLENYLEQSTQTFFQNFDQEIKQKFNNGDTEIEGTFKLLNFYVENLVNACALLSNNIEIMRAISPE